MKVLFNEHDVSNLRDELKVRVREEIDGVPEITLLETNLEEWITHFLSEYEAKVPVLFPTQATCDMEDCQVDARNLTDRHVWDMNTPSYVDGTLVKYFIPFEGDENYFYVHPNQYGGVNPRGEIENGELCFEFHVGANYNPEDIKRGYDQALSLVQQKLNLVKSDMSEYNTTLPTLIRQRLTARLEKLKKDHANSTQLGVPLRRRTSAPNTYSVPVQRKVIAPRPSPSTRGPLEPALSEGDYDGIMSVLNNMVDVMERTPDAFRTMDEETLRSHFLVQLNGQFDGGATAETFNAAGKTDILLKVSGKCVFIAECKIWKGAVVFNEAMTQLLSYLSWRDTKAALLIFNRNKDTANVLKQIPDLAKQHSNYLRDWKTGSRETEFKYIFHQNGDKGREILLAVEVYDVPS